MTMDTQPTRTRWLDTVQIRHLIRDDLPALEWGGDYTHFRQMFLRMYHMARQGSAVLWVATSHTNKMLGQVFVQLNGTRSELSNGLTHGYLFSFRVIPKYRGAGLGARLLSTAENDLVRRGYVIATLNVARENPRAQRFYERHGYTVVGKEEGRWSYRDHNNHIRHVHEPSWRMEKVIAPARN